VSFGAKVILGGEARPMFHCHQNKIFPCPKRVTNKNPEHLVIKINEELSMISLFLAFLKRSMKSIF
jgi:hypothetical protein